MQVHSVSKLAFYGQIGMAMRDANCSGYTPSRYKEIDVSDISCIADREDENHDGVVINLKNDNQYFLPVNIAKVLAAYNAAKDSDITIIL